MKRLGLLSVCVLAHNPLDELIGQLKGMRETIIIAGEDEQKAWDKYSCWCEDETARLKKSVEHASVRMDYLWDNIENLKGEIGVDTVDLSQIVKNLAALVKTLKETWEKRVTDLTDYSVGRSDNEDALAKLEQAIKVLQGAGRKDVKKAGFLQQKSLKSAAAGLQSLLSRPDIIQNLLGDDLELVSKFIEAPDSAAFVQNPKGDYAPASGRLQGLLKGMYDGLVAELEKADGEEATAVDNNVKITGDRTEQQWVWNVDRKTTNTSLINEKNWLVGSKEEFFTLRKKMRDDRKLLGDVTNTCADRARDWSERVRLRTGELQAILNALNVLSSKKMKKIFAEAANTFMQISSTTTLHRNAAYTQVKKLATEFHSMKLARVAAQLKLGGTFDEIVGKLAKIIKDLKQEDKQDLDEKDRCEGNHHQRLSDLKGYEQKSKALERTHELLSRKVDQLEGDLHDLSQEINQSKEEIDDVNHNRNDEWMAFKKAVDADLKATAALRKVRKELNGFYELTHTDLLQLTGKPPPPAFGTKTGAKDYDTKSNSAVTILSLIDMMISDNDHEIKRAKRIESKAKSEYESNVAERREMLAGLEQDKLNTKELLDQTTGERSDTKLAWGRADEGAEMADKDVTTMEAAAGCVPKVVDGFQDRHDKRLTEIEGCTAARQFLVDYDASK